VAATPDSRDRVVDAARGAALAVVVVGHGVMAVVAWPGGVPRLGNLLAAFPWTQALTWLLQIMPLFFWAGGAANGQSWAHRRPDATYASWLWGRGRRLLRPVIVYLLVMSVVAVLVTWLAPADVAAPLMALTTQLLWFLGAYLITVALTPWLLVGTLGRGLLGVCVLVAASGAVDVARLMLGWPEAIGLANFVLVWTLPALLGAMRSEGLLRAVPAPALLLAAAALLVANGVLIRQGPWPISMVGMPGEPVSNMAPPTLVLALHCLTLVAVVEAADGPLSRLLRRPAVWRPVVAVNLTAMTVYLWHLPVLIGLTTLGHVLGLERPAALDPGGFPVPAGWGYAWGSAAFWAVYLVGVVLIVRLMWPFEYVPLPWWDSAPRVPLPAPRVAGAVAGMSVFVVGTSTLVLSAAGLGGFPTHVVTYAGLPLSAAGAMAGLLLGGALLRWAGAPRRSADVPRPSPATP
jgi:fucose 4-O-acetylase-like acetyltransferase